MALGSIDLNSHMEGISHMIGSAPKMWWSTGQVHEVDMVISATGVMLATVRRAAAVKIRVSRDGITKPPENVSALRDQYQLLYQGTLTA